MDAHAPTRTLLQDRYEAPVRHAVEESRKIFDGVATAVQREAEAVLARPEPSSQALATLQALFDRAQAGIAHLFAPLMNVRHDAGVMLRTMKAIDNEITRLDDLRDTINSTKKKLGGIQPERYPIDAMKLRVNELKMLITGADMDKQLNLMRDQIRALNNRFEQDKQRETEAFEAFNERIDVLKSWRTKGGKPDEVKMYIDSASSFPGFNTRFWEDRLDKEVRRFERSLGDLKLQYHVEKDVRRLEREEAKLNGLNKLEQELENDINRRVPPGFYRELRAGRFQLIAPTVRLAVSSATLAGRPKKIAVDVMNNDNRAIKVSIQFGDEEVRDLHLLKRGMRCKFKVDCEPGALKVVVTAMGARGEEGPRLKLTSCNIPSVPMNPRGRGWTALLTPQNFTPPPQENVHARQVYVQDPDDCWLWFDQKIPGLKD